MPDNRRHFIKTSSLGLLGALALPQLITPAGAESRKSRKITLKENDVIVFQGDSITDFNRPRPSLVNDNLGAGYVFVAASEMLRAYPEKKLQIYNTGVSGNKVFQLADRWEADCIALKPTVLSILIGVNDYWHTLNGAYKEGTVEKYRNDYKKLLNTTLQKLPDVRLIIGEPFAIPGVRTVNDSWFPAFDAYRQAAREVADEYKAVFIPYQQLFNEALKKASGSYWTKDGVHPAAPGVALMAEAWLQAIKG